MSLMIWLQWYVIDDMAVATCRVTDDIIVVTRLVTDDIHVVIRDQAWNKLHYNVIYYNYLISFLLLL